jgi:tRNA dimethylallyltransferase
MVATKKEPIIVLVGETASGKSELAMFLAKEFNGEIINADSWAVYKGFDIGTAKPSSSERLNVKHHLIDVADPLEGYSAAVFKRQAMVAISKIHSRNKVPILTGGTGLYIDSVLYDYSFLPPSSPGLREKYNLMTIDELREEIIKLKYDTVGIDTNNKRRLIRLLENKGVRPEAKLLQEEVLILGISIETEVLKDRIEKRVDSMLTAGLENENRRLAKKYGWGIEPMKGIGYREFKAYFEGTKSLAETRDMIIKDSLQLTKKQRTWFKRNNSIHWVSKKSNIVMIVTTYLNKFK